jgi:hypothetical protein
MKICERRLQLITGTAPVPVKSNDKAGKNPKSVEKARKKAEEQAEKEEREWGQLPTLSRTELLSHYAKAVAECMGKLEDAYERNPKSTALTKALTELREATDRHLTILRSLTAAPGDDPEGRALARAIDEAETANAGARSGLNRK